MDGVQSALSTRVFRSSLGFEFRDRKEHLQAVSVIESTYLAVR